jgi:hypothetical protein
MNASSYLPLRASWLSTEKQVGRSSSNAAWLPVEPPMAGWNALSELAV